LEEAAAGFLGERTQLRGLLDGRYDQMKSRQVKPIDGHEAFVRLRRKNKTRRGS
jgi:hypothetical protein